MSTTHTVRPGETLSSIARAYQFKSWQDLYWHADNKNLRQKRPSGNLIFPGDLVMIPDRFAVAKPVTGPAPVPLPCDSKAAAVALLKTSAKLDTQTQQLLTRGLVIGIIAAERKRMNVLEKEGIDDDTFGPGQIGQLAYTDVVNTFKSELSQFLMQMGAQCGASLPRGCGVSLKPLVQKGYPQDVIDPVVSDFFIAAYLALRIKEAAKPGRSAEDQLQFGIGIYLGARGRIARAQAALSPVDQGASVTDYPRGQEPLAAFERSEGPGCRSLYRRSFQESLTGVIDRDATRRGQGVPRVTLWRWRYAAVLPMIGLDEG